MKPSLKEILEVTLEELNVTQRHYKEACKSRLSNIVLAKQIVCYVATHFGYSQHSIASFLKIDRTNVSYHKSLAENYSKIEKKYAVKVNKVMSRFENVRYCHSKLGWVARDKDTMSLTFFREKPIDNDGSWYADSYQYSLPFDHFPQVSYDDSPRRCEVTFRLK